MSITISGGLTFGGGLILASEASASSDPFYSNVSLLLPMDGANGSTTFVDNSPSPKSTVVNGAAQVSTSVFKYGTGSLSLDGNRSYLVTGTQTDWTFLHNCVNPWTVEFWIKINNLSGAAADPMIINTVGGSFVNYLNISLNSTLNVGATIKRNTGANVYDATSTAPIPSDGQWHFIAVVLNPTLASNQLSFFIDGTLSGQGSYLGNPATLDPPQVPLTIGAWQPVGGFGNFNGYIDELRITNGVARYTSNFTPPDAPFPNQ